MTSLIAIKTELVDNVAISMKMVAAAKTAIGKPTLDGEVKRLADMLFPKEEFENVKEVFEGIEMEKNLVEVGAENAFWPVSIGHPLPTDSYSLVNRRHSSAT